MKSILLLIFLLSCASSRTFASQLISSKTLEENEEISTDCSCIAGKMDCSGLGKTTFSSYNRCPSNILYLYLSRNKITNVPTNAFASLTNLTYLFLHNNNISEISKELFSDLHSLRSLILSFNNLKTVPEDVFSTLKSLETFIVAANKLQTLPAGVFRGLKHLTTVSLQNNQITTLPAGLFAGINSMHMINLKGNELAKVPPGLFQNISYTRFLDLSDNHLTNLSSQDLNGITEMYRLDITGNNITSLPQRDATWPQIDLSYWWGNNMERVTEEDIRSWLRNGEPCELHLDGPKQHTTYFPAADLQWVLSDDAIRTTANEGKCDCGMLQLGRARVLLCVNVQCGPDSAYADWVAAVRAIGQRLPSSKGNARYATEMIPTTRSATY